MRASPLVLVAALVAVGHSFQTPAWARDLSARLDEVPNTLSSLVAREPKRGGGGSSSHSSGSSDDDDDDDDSSSSGGSSCDSSSNFSTDNCLSTEKVCQGGCIAKDAICCPTSDLPGYCESNERCVVSPTTTSTYRCCPANDFSCDGSSIKSTVAWPPQHRFSSSNGNCASTSGATHSTTGGMQALVGGVALSFAVGIAR
ncbi:uncharacterized protein DNG_04510 [Cephalotrichum gorgonifer]|uniref:GPI anchored protein n=1 Tax=Cephalotrichum gorgonifer TaxID=2041049 RepID=A0AAE8MWI8_9PEZI|nr:uncharacterized protein DNG_04510 [Cephalotrichum gorgonifer]